MYNSKLTLLLTLDIRPGVVLLLHIVLIQFLAAKPNKPIIIIIIIINQGRSQGRNNPAEPILQCRAL